MHFTEAAQGLNYRRFFEIAGLVGLRVEDETVFNDVHQTVLDLVRRDVLQGLRIDHVDGLADPSAYLSKLRAAIGEDVYLVVEKILAPGETLPSDWPVEGTTGYEFIASQVPVLLDADGFRAVRKAYEQVSGGASDIALEMRAAKRQMIRVNFAGEVNALLRQGVRLTGFDKKSCVARSKSCCSAFRATGPTAGTTPFRLAIAPCWRKFFATPAEASPMTRLMPRAVLPLC